MADYVEIEFSCLPLRTIGRLDIPLDASPKFQERCHLIKTALEKHGSHNSYFLYDAQCRFHLTNSPEKGMLEFKFAGTVLTDVNDQTANQADLEVELASETTDWLKEPIVEWFKESVAQAVLVEFNMFIQSGDLEKARQRLARLQTQSDQSSGYLGMFL